MRRSVTTALPAEYKALSIQVQLLLRFCHFCALSFCPAVSIPTSVQPDNFLYPSSFLEDNIKRFPTQHARGLFISDLYDSGKGWMRVIDTLFSPPSNLTGIYFRSIYGHDSEAHRLLLFAPHEFSSHSYIRRDLFAIYHDTSIYITPVGQDLSNPTESSIFIYVTTFGLTGKSVC